MLPSRPEVVSEHLFLSGDNTREGRFPRLKAECTPTGALVANTFLLKEHMRRYVPCLYSSRNIA
jgi:hypothetical protein